MTPVGSARALGPLGGGVSADGVLLPAACEEVVDVLLDDQRVWTVTPTRFEPVDGVREAPWPKNLRPWLTGSTRLVLREHVSGTVWYDDEHAFDERPGRTSVVDEAGYPLAVDKWGFLVRTFGSSDSSVARLLLDDLEELLRLLDEELGLPAFIAYGTLLGAVRDGTFIGHDNDADISYVSAHDHPADIAAESFRLESALRARGWTTFRSTGAFLQVSRADDAQRKIDIFAGFFREDHLTIERWVRAPVPRSAVLPLGVATLAGRELPAPARPEEVLAATYGEGWAVPDPGFIFTTPRYLERRSSGWFGEFWRQEGLWADRTADEEALTGPTWAARWAEDQVDADAPVVDLGCGTGRDAHHLARDGRRVVGLDYSAAALRAARRRVGGSSTADFARLSLEDLRGTLVTTARLATTLGPATQATCVDLLGALTPGSRSTLWHGCRVLLAGGGRLHLSYVAPTDPAGEPQPATAPGRPAPPLEEVVEEVSRHGGTVHDHDHVQHDGVRWARLVASWDAPR